MISRTRQGLLYPDIYVIKFFFKHGMHQRSGNVLELGCGNGNNLCLFRDFGWRSVGIDNNRKSINDGQVNFAHDDPSEITFHQWDLNEGLPRLEEKFDVLLLPNVVNYLKPQALEDLLAECKGVCRDGAFYMISCRSTNDWRFGRGRQVGDNSFIMDTDITDELGTMQTFYDSEELVSLVERHLGPTVNSLVLRYDYDNLQRGEVIDNHDFVVWGRIA